MNLEICECLDAEAQKNRSEVYRIQLNLQVGQNGEQNSRGRGWWNPFYFLHSNHPEILELTDIYRPSLVTNSDKTEML